MKYHLCNVEPDVTPYLTLPPDGVAFDVGACVGTYTYQLLDVVPQGRVFAFEPEPKNYAFLQSVFQDRPNVTVLHMALADYEGIGALFTHASSFTRQGEEWIISGNVANHFLIGSDPHQPVASLKPPCYPTLIDVHTIDHIVAHYDLPRVDLIKIDTEGSELPILRGAKRTLAQHRPRLIIEVHYDEGDEVERLTRAAGYTVTKHIPLMSSNPGLILDVNGQNQRR